MKIYMGSDHAAYEEKEELKNYLRERGYQVEDCGPFSPERCDYPDFASLVAKSVVKDRGARGILLCGSGIGVSMVANRFAGIRAAFVHTKEEARLSRAHNKANILCLGGRSTSFPEREAMVKVWLETPFEEGRHRGRIEKFDKIGERV